jgi:hypothetical protein
MGALHDESTPKFGWALQLHADGVAYLRPTTDQRLHVSLPQDTFEDAEIVLDPNTGEHVIHQLQNSQYVDSQQQYQVQMQMQINEQEPAPGGWGWPAIGFMPADDAYAGFGAFPWEPQVYLHDEQDVATTECAPALCIMWWMLGLRQWLHLVGHGSTRPLLVASVASTTPKKRQRTLRSQSCDE